MLKGEGFLILLRRGIFSAQMKNLYRILYEDAEQRCIESERTIEILEEALRSLMCSNQTLRLRNHTLESVSAEQQKLITMLQKRLAGKDLTYEAL